MDNLDKNWFDIDLAVRKKLAEQLKGIPLAELELTVRTYHVLHRHDDGLDVAALLCMDDGIYSIRGIGPKALKEINDRFMPLIKGSEMPFSTLRETSKEMVRLELTDGATLPEAIAKLSLDRLYLPRGVSHTLIDAGIKTIGETSRIPIEEMQKIPDLDEEGRSLVIDRVTAIQGAFDEELGQVNWYRFWFSQGISDNIRKCLVQLPDIVDTAFPRDERIGYILKHRYGLDGKPTLTLDELSTVFGLTREQVRQKEIKGIQRLRGILLMSPDFTQEFSILSREISEAGDPGIPEKNLQERLMASFAVDAQTLERVWEFLLEIYGVERIRLKPSVLEPILSSNKKALPTQTTMIISTIHRYLTEKATSSSEIDVLLEVNQKLGKRDRIQLADLRRVIPFCNTIELVRPGIYRGKFEYLNTRSNQIERIFIDTDEPLTISALAREFNFRVSNTGGQPVEERNFSSQLSSDNRFSSIGRSGTWTLTRWSAETGNIIDIMKQYLMTKNTPATIEEIAAHVQKKRPASDASIKSYLHFDPSFAQATRSTWGLATWEEVRMAKNWNPEEVAAFVEDFFRGQKVRQIEYKVLKEALMKASGYSTRRVQGLLNVNPAITTETIKGDKRIAVFQPDYQDKLEQGLTRFPKKQKTLFEHIEVDVRQALESAPGKQMGLKKLVDLLTEKYGKRYTKPYQSLHGYVSRMDFVEKVPVDGSKQLMCRLVTDDSGELRARAEQIRTTTLRSNVIRSLTFLTEADVDVALFLLSKEFEATLQRYVELAIQVGTLPPLGPRERLKLDGMISKIKNANILTDDAVLSFLRQSRNDRAHGAMPSQEERKIMMSQIGVTAGMYIDYIQFFDGLAFDLEVGS